MIITQTTRRLLLASMLSAFFAAPALAKGSDKLAVQLLDVSSLNSLYNQGILFGYTKSATSANRPAAEISCFTSKVTPQVTMQALSAGYTAEFADPELQAAIAFFESKTGKKFAQFQRVKSSAVFGVTSPEKEPELTKADLATIDAFLETRIGKLIVAANSPMSTTAREMLLPQMNAFDAQCRKPGS